MPESSSNGSTLRPSLDGPLEAVECDRINSGGTLTLDGTLDVSFVSAATPAPDTTWVILSATSIVGAFDSITLPEDCVLRRTIQRIEVYLPCTSDIDADGDVDSDDITELFAAFEAGSDVGDTDNDGDVDSDDLILFFDRFDAGC